MWDECGFLNRNCESELEIYFHHLNMMSSKIVYFEQGWGWLTDFRVQSFWFPPGRLTG